MRDSLDELECIHIAHLRNESEDASILHIEWTDVLNDSFIRQFFSKRVFGNLGKHAEAAKMIYQYFLAKMNTSIHALEENV